MTYGMHKTRTYSLITAICLSLFTVYKVIEESGYMQSYGTLAKLVTILEITGYIGLTVASFVLNKRIAFIAAIVCFCVKVYVLAVNFTTVFYFLPLAYAALLVIILLSINGKGIIRYLWYISGLLLFFRWLYITKIYNFDIGFLLNGSNWMGYLSTILEAVTFLFAGLWLKEETTMETVKNTN